MPRSDALARSAIAGGRDRAGGDVREHVELDGAFQRLGELERAEGVHDDARIRRRECG